MIIYRVGKTKHSRDLSGEGARLFGGRWNHKLTPCVYASESRALAVLEYSANASIDDIPRALSITTLKISDKAIKCIEIAELPGDWSHAPAPRSAKDFGTELLKSLNQAVIKIPSAVIPQEFNYLLNPLHPDSKHFEIISVEDFVYDLRIKL